MTRARVLIAAGAVLLLMSLFVNVPLHGDARHGSHRGGLDGAADCGRRSRGERDCPAATLQRPLGRGVSCPS